MRFYKSVLSLFVLAMFIITSCAKTSMRSPTTANDSPVLTASKARVSASSDRRPLDPGMVSDIHSINEQYAKQGLNIRLAYAETVTLKDNGNNKALGGQTIYANDREKRLTSQWVAGDERRYAEGNKLTYLTWGPYSIANYSGDQIDAEPAIDASFNTWNSVKKNAKLEIVKVPDTGANPSGILGGNPFLADITELGFLPGIYFELFLGPGASTSVLGVTFTYVFIDEAGNPTDINNDGYSDTAFKEVWYNDAFVWTDTGDTSQGVDIETVALHENGHALGFGHFGKISITNGNGKLHVSPRSVMNAIILGTQRELLGTDKASYTNIYGSWPK